MAGQSRGVSLPVFQQRMLEQIETHLEGSEPRLRSMFAIFTRLNRDEGVPRIESLGGPRGRLSATVRAAIAIPLLLGLVALFVFIAVSSSASGCRPVTGPYGGVARAVSCQLRR